MDESKIGATVRIVVGCESGNCVGRVEAIDEHGVDVKVTTLTGFPAYGPPIGLAVTATCLDDAMPAGTGFSQLLNLRVFQQYLRSPDGWVDVERT